MGGVPDEILGRAVESDLTRQDRVQISVLRMIPSSKINRTN